MGTDTYSVNQNIKLIKKKKLDCGELFLQNNHEINLPSNLDIDLSNVDFPSLSKTVNIDICSPLKEKKDDLENSWAKIISKGLKPST